MSLKLKLIDAVIDGKLGLRLSRADVIREFPDVTETYTGVILSNSEMEREHSPSYESFTIRVGRGVYLIHPDIIKSRMKQLGLL